MMRAMKNSGVSWIGTIPVDWEVRRTKYCFTVNHGSDPKTDSGNTPVYGSGNNSFKTCEEFKVGPAVLVGRKGTINIPQWIVGNYWNVDTAFDVQPKGNYDLKLYYYASMCFDYDAVATQTALPSMTQFDYLNFRLPFMDADIQQQIVSYLDAKCDAIDKAIAHKRSVIEKLKEYRTAVITKAVTKGLNPDVEMKDSGNDIIGFVPKDWKCKRMKFIVDVVRGGSPRPIEQYLSDKGYNWIKIGDATNNGKYINNTQQKIIPDGLSKTRFVKKNTLLLTNSMSFGHPYFLNIDGCIHDGWLAFSNYKDVTKEFLYYVLISNTSMAQFSTSVEGSVVVNLNIQKVRNSFVALPAIAEQQQIASYLDDKCNKIDIAIHQQEQVIDKLEEYRKSVIYYAVTGKKEVSA